MIWIKNRAAISQLSLSFHWAISSVSFSYFSVMSQLLLSNHLVISQLSISYHLAIAFAAVIIVIVIIIVIVVVVHHHRHRHHHQQLHSHKHPYIMATHSTPSSMTLKKTRLSIRHSCAAWPCCSVHLLIRSCFGSFLSFSARTLQSPTITSHYWLSAWDVWITSQNSGGRSETYCSWWNCIYVCPVRDILAQALGSVDDVEINAWKGFWGDKSGMQ